MSAHNPAECLTCRATADEEDRKGQDIAELQRRVERLRMLSISKHLEHVRDVTGETA